MPRELQPICFAPSRAEGWPDVSEVIFFPDHLEICTEGRWEKVRFEEIGRGSAPASVGERFWEPRPAGQWMRFYTSPPLTISMPVEEIAGPYEDSTFRRIQDLLAAGGYWLFDLG